MPDPVLEAAAVADSLIGVAAHVEAELEEALAEHRLTRPSFQVLDALERADGRTLNQRDLVRQVRRTQGTMSVRLGRLERAHLIERRPDPDNRRSVTVTLTERGRQLVVAARPAYAERASRLLAGVSEDGAGALAAALEAWLEFFEPGEGVAPLLGVAVATAAVAKRMRRAVGLADEAGVLVMRVARDSPADAAGLARGDLVTAAGETAVRSIGDLERAVRAAGGTLTLSVLRGAEPRALEVAFSGEAPAPALRRGAREDRPTGAPARNRRTAAGEPRAGRRGRSG